jgi:hypothetical protein
MGTPVSTERAAAVRIAADEHPAPSIREQIVLSAARQGPSFLLLLLVLFGLWRIGDYVLTEGLAAAIDQIQAGYREIQRSHDANLRDLVAAFERDEQRDRAALELVRDLVENREILKASHAILVELRAARGEGREKAARAGEAP